VAGRVLAFSDERVIQRISEEFVAAAGDDWYRRRQDDRVGEFFRAVADQGPRRGEGGGTRQGLYCFTADGTLLAYKNVQRAKDVLGLLDRALEEWKKLPAKERAPRKLDLATGKLDQRYDRRLPEGSTVVRVHARALERRDDGTLARTKRRRGPVEGTPFDIASLDHLWLRREECAALVPATATIGTTFPLPEKLRLRLIRFHLVDNTLGEPPFWSADEIREQKIELTVTQLDEDVVELALRGAVKLASRDEKRGFHAELTGRIVQDRSSFALRRFDVVAVGDHWGQGQWNGPARPGRAPLGIAFQLADGKSPADGVPPQAAREIAPYWGD
jgi:hypothetical protein